MVMPIGVYREVRLTGLKRVRRGWFGKLILQVEVVLVYQTPYLTRPRPPHHDKVLYCAPDEIKFWRDATASDVDIEYAHLPLVI